jgi:hypothetical protein
VISDYLGLGPERSNPKLTKEKILTIPKLIVKYLSNLKSR